MVSDAVQQILAIPDLQAQGRIGHPGPLGRCGHALALDSGHDGNGICSCRPKSLIASRALLPCATVTNNVPGSTSSITLNLRVRMRWTRAPQISCSEHVMCR